MTKMEGTIKDLQILCGRMLASISQIRLFPGVNPTPAATAASSITTWLRRPEPWQHRRGAASFPSVCGRTNKQHDINFLAVTFMAGSEESRYQAIGLYYSGNNGELESFLSRWAPSHLAAPLRRDCCSGR